MKSIDIESLEPKDTPYKVGAGGSLFIIIQPNREKRWRFKYRFQGKESQLSFGAYPQISYEQAVIERDKARALLKAGANLSEIRRLERQEKQTLKPKVSFSMQLSESGALTVQTKATAIHLTPKKSGALRSFLNTQQNEEGGKYETYKSEMPKY